MEGRNLIVCATSMTFRFAYYGFWTLADSGILATGLTSEGNINAMAIETATIVNKFWSNWNITTHLWLKRCIYQQLPESCRGLVGVFIVFLVCGAWVSLLQLPSTFVQSLTSLIKHGAQTKYFG